MKERVKMPPGRIAKLSVSMAFKKRVPIRVASDISASDMRRCSRRFLNSSPSVGIVGPRDSYNSCSELIGNLEKLILRHRNKRVNAMGIGGWELGVGASNASRLAFSVLAFSVWPERLTMNAEREALNPQPPSLNAKRRTLNAKR